METKFEFRVGDIVKIIGDKNNTYIVEKSDSYSYPIGIDFPFVGLKTFTKIGQRSYDSNSVYLELVERPKRLVKKTIEIKKWMNIYPSGDGLTHNSKDYLDRIATSNRIACVELVGTYEIKVEE